MTTSAEFDTTLILSPSNKAKHGTRTPDPASPSSKNNIKVDESSLAEAVFNKFMQASEKIEKQIENNDF